MVGPKNRVIAHPDHAYVSELRDLGDYPPVAALRKGVKGQFSFVDGDGKRWRSHISMLDNGWGIIVQQLETELLDAQFLFQKVAFFVILLAAVILFAVTWWALRRALNSVELLSTAVANITTGDMTILISNRFTRWPVHIHTHDEVGTLAESFNNMALKLEGTLGSLEQELAERKQIEVSLRENEKSTALWSITSISASTAAHPSWTVILSRPIRPWSRCWAMTPLKSSFKSPLQLFTRTRKTDAPTWSRSASADSLRIKSLISRKRTAPHCLCHYRGRPV